MIDQVSRVEAAEKAVELARADMIKKQHDVEKLKEHKLEWEKEMRALETHKEGVQSDELGTVMHSVKKKGKNRG